MRTERYTVLPLALAAAAMLAVAREEYAFALAMAALATFGAVTGLRLRVSREWDIILNLATLALFLAAWQYAERTGPIVIVLGRLGGALAEFFLFSMCLAFVLRREDRLPPRLPLFGLLSAICAGDAHMTGRDAYPYRVLTVVYVILMIVHYAATVRRAPAGTAPAVTARRRRRVALGVYVVLAGLLSVVIGEGMVRYQHELERLAGGALVRGLTRVAALAQSPTARLGAVARHKWEAGADRVALRVVAEDSPGYLKGETYVRYNRSTWGADQTRVPLPVASSPPGSLALPPEAGLTFIVRPTGSENWRTFHVWPSADSDGNLFTPTGTAAVTMRVGALDIGPGGAVQAPQSPPELDYRAHVPGAAPAEPAPTGVLRGRMEALPPEIGSLARRLAAEVAGDRTTDRERIEAVVGYFQDNYRYELGVRPPPGVDPLAWFLTKQPAAHCEYFASGAAVLLRALGIPTRYVTGFVAGERNAAAGYWLARNRDAHAWVEAYDRQRGWVIVEATPPAGVPTPAPVGVWRRRWDETMFALRRLKIALVTDGLLGLWRWVWGAARAFLLATSVPALIAKIVLLAWIVRSAARRLRPRRTVRAPEPHVLALRNVLRGVDARVRRRGLVRGASEPIRRFARRVQPVDAPAATWYERYAAVRYRTPQKRGAPDELRRAASELPDPE